LTHKQLVVILVRENTPTLDNDVGYDLLEI